MWKGLLVASLAGICACNGNGNDSSTDGSVTADPVGAVGGLVLDGASGQPLAGATVTVVSGGMTATATSGADGTFAVTGLPPGALIVELAASDHLSAFLTADLPADAGDVALAHPSTTIGPIGLVSSAGTFAIRVVDQTGEPVSGVSVTATTQGSQYIDYSSGAPVARGSETVTAASDLSGTLTLTGLPDYAGLGEAVDDTLLVDVPPMAVANGTYTFFGLNLTFHPDAVTTSVPTVVLAGPQTPLQVLATNLRYLLGATSVITQVDPIEPAGEMQITFNQAIDVGTVRLQLYEEDATTPAPVQMQALAIENSLTITPSAALLAGHRYNLAIHVDALTSPHSTVTNELNTTTPVFTAPTNGVPVSIVGTPTKVQDPTGNVIVTFTLNQPIGLGVGNSSATSCVAFYEGVNLDNGDPALYAGEYSAGPALQCWAQANPLPAIDATAIRPVEAAPPSLITGFATKWQVTVNNPSCASNPCPCKPNIPAGVCTGPVAGTRVHLVFSSLPIGQTLRTYTGDPLTASPTNLTFTIP